ncbi:MAG: recombinase RecT [Deltaproteobacteria bacterium]|nr:recombinase RecT [Deltaproteobacteria bacterium]
MNELAKRDNGFTNIQTLKEWGAFAQQSGIVPQGTSQHQAMAIIQTGVELGLAPMQSLRSMSFVKGRLVMSVQLQLALARQRGVKVVKIDEKDGYCGVTLERQGEEVSCAYTLQDARKAGLVKQDGNWDKYPKQMLRWRAIGDALRLLAPDLVMGLLSQEEAEGIEESVTHSQEPEAGPEEAQAPSCDETPPPPGNTKTTNYKFLEAMAAQKKRVGNETYYGVLVGNGYEHANLIIDRDEQVKIYNEMLARPDLAGVSS